MATQQAASGGIGLGGAVFLVFLVLKLTGYIDWSWWWVTVPIWGVFAAVLGVMIASAAVYALVMCVSLVVGALAGGRRSRR